MKTFVLDTVNKSLQVIVSGVPTTPLDYTVHWADVSSSALTETSGDGTIASGTTVILASPATNHTLLVRTISIQNSNPTPIPLKLVLVNSGNNRLLWYGTLNQNDTWTMDGIIDTNGVVKSGVIGPSGSQGPMGSGSSGGGINSGNSFPTGSIASGTLFYRSDVSFLCFWNGAYWLTVQEFNVFMLMHDAFNTTGAANLPLPCIPRQDYPPYFTQIDAQYRCNLNATGTVYWIIPICTSNEQNSVFYPIYIVDTSNAPGGLTGTHYNVKATNPTPPAYAYLGFGGGKVGNPATYYFGANVNYRLIIT